MSRSGDDRLDDIANAITAIRSHLEHGPISVEIVMDAVAMRLLEIGEPAKGLSPELTTAEPDRKAAARCHTGCLSSAANAARCVSCVREAHEDL